MTPPLLVDGTAKEDDVMFTMEMPNGHLNVTLPATPSATLLGDPYGADPPPARVLTVVVAAVAPSVTIRMA